MYSTPDDVHLCYLGEKLPSSLEKYNQSTLRRDQDICDQWNSELGWIPKSNCNSEKYFTNSQGFRGEKEFSLYKDKTRIIILGDSFTWGENNYANETYPYYLDQLFNEEIDVINMGVHGYGPDQFYIYFNKTGRKYLPDIVVFGLFIPSIQRTTVRIRDYFKPRFIIEKGSLILDKNSKIPNFETVFKLSFEKKKEFRFYSLSRLYLEYSRINRRLKSYDKETKITLKIIEKLKEISKKDDFKLLVLLIPSQDMIEKGNSDYYGVLPKIKEGLEKQEIEYLDVLPSFINHSKISEQSLYQGHLRPIANHIIAAELYGFLKYEI